MWRWRGSLRVLSLLVDLRPFQEWRVGPLISLQHLVARTNAGKIVHLTLVQVQRLLQFGVLLVHDPSDISGRHHANQRGSLLHIPIGYHPLLPDLALIQNAHLVVFYSFLDLLFDLVVDV